MKREGERAVEQLQDWLVACQPAESERLAGAEVYAGEVPPNERMAAEPLPERGAWKAPPNEPVRYGHTYSGRVRLVPAGTSWTAPRAVRRGSTHSTATQTGAAPVPAWARRNPHLKGLAVDSRDRDKHVLGVLADLENTYALVRLQNNQKLSEKPVPRPPRRAA